MSVFEPPSQHTSTPAYVTGQQPPPYPSAQAAPPAGLLPPRRRKVWPWLAGLAALLIVGSVAAAALITRDGDPATAPVAASASPAVSEEMRVECVNVARAYRAWNTDRVPKTLLQVQKLNEYTVKWVMEAGDEFSSAVGGYQDQPAKLLAVRVAEYNVAVSEVNFMLTLNGEVELATADKVVASVSAIHAAFRTFEEQCS